jgi:hypothetical protein
MDKQEEVMWAKDKICFQRLVLNEMKQNTNTDKWVAGMIGTEIEVARTIEAWVQRRGGLEKYFGKKKRGLHQHFHMEYDGREAGIGASAGKEGDMGRSGQIGGGGKRGVLM